MGDRRRGRARLSGVLRATERRTSAGAFGWTVEAVDEIYTDLTAREGRARGR